MLPTRQLYKQELMRCRENFEQLDLTRERGYLMKFTTFSANVENVVPTIPRQEHETLFRELLTQQVFATFDQHYLTSVDLVKLRGHYSSFRHLKEPRIYCAYHLGSYRMLTSVLFRQGIDCVLLVGSNMNRQHGQELIDWSERLRHEHGLTNGFRIVEAGSPSAGLTVLRELKAGKSLIVFVDGSPETAPEAGEEHQFLAVRFGKRRVLTRKGVGYLSHASNVPIVPVISYRLADMTNVLHCLKPIRPIPKSDREMYCQEVMQQLFDAFWPFLIKYPGQWEGWNFIHSFLEPEASEHTFFDSVTQRLHFNEYRYSLCDLEDAPILFDRRLYQTYEITADLRDLLLNINTIDSVKEVVGHEVFNELVELEVIR